MNSSLTERPGTSCALPSFKITAARQASSRIVLKEYGGLKEPGAGLIVAPPTRIDLSDTRESRVA